MNRRAPQGHPGTTGAGGNAIPFPRHAKLPSVEFGTGWYHDAAIAEERQAKLQPRPEWHPFGRG